jgi:hypothetical protein
LQLLYETDKYFHVESGKGITCSNPGEVLACIAKAIQEIDGEEKASDA